MMWTCHLQILGENSSAIRQPQRRYLNCFASLLIFSWVKKHFDEFLKLKQGSGE
jgi:hypothetical protein